MSRFPRLVLDRSDYEPNRTKVLSKKRCRIGFTLIELFVVIAIIGVLFGLLGPTVQSIRESARRAACQANMVSLGMAIQSYHDRYLHYPIGTIDSAAQISHETKGLHHNWIGRLLELMDEPVIAKRIDRSVSIYDPKNEIVLNLNYPGVKCPSAGSDLKNASSYVGVYDEKEVPITTSNSGVFMLNESITRDDVLDGLSATLFVSEKRPEYDDLGWLSGTRATLRNVQAGIISARGPRTSAMSPSNEVDAVKSATTDSNNDDSDRDRVNRQTPISVAGSIGSNHPAGVNALFGSGEIRFLSDQTDQRVLDQMANRRDGQLPLQYQSIESLRRQSL